MYVSNEIKENYNSTSYYNHYDKPTRVQFIATPTGRLMNFAANVVQSKHYGSIGVCASFKYTVYHSVRTR